MGRAKRLLAMGKAAGLAGMATLAAVGARAATVGLAASAGVSEPGCGLNSQQFVVVTDQGMLAPLKSSEMARIVIAQPGETAEPSGERFRVGVDGTWVSALRDYSWQLLIVKPGLHDVCINWELPVRALAKETALDEVQAKAGKTVFLELDVEGDAGKVTAFDLFGLVPDEGKYLVTSLPHAVAEVEK